MYLTQTHILLLTNLMLISKNIAFLSNSISKRCTSILKLDLHASSDSLSPRIKIKKILENDSAVGKAVTVKGWVRTVRDQKKFAFIEVNDGSTLSGIQAVADAEIPTFSEINRRVLVPNSCTYNQIC